MAQRKIAWWELVMGDNFPYWIFIEPGCVVGM